VVLGGSGLSKGAAALRALRIHMDEREAEKDLSHYYETLERVTERHRGGGDCSSFVAIVRAVAADPEAIDVIDMLFFRVNEGHEGLDALVEKGRLCVTGTHDASVLG
jgi:hypothetical protein